MIGFLTTTLDIPHCTSANLTPIADPHLITGHSFATAFCTVESLTSGLNFGTHKGIRFKSLPDPRLTPAHTVTKELQNNLCFYRLAMNSSTQVKDQTRTIVQLCTNLMSTCVQIMVKILTGIEIPHEFSQACTQMYSMCPQISLIQNICISFWPDT